MTPTDPLSEALDLVKGLMPYVADRPFVLADVSKQWARLDALPAPVRIRKATLGPKTDGWFYPDAPSDGGDDA